MESSAPKRRKTSPTAAVHVESTASPDPPPEQPQQQPEELRGRPSSTTSPKVPSFAAPTTSSLARSNPDILAPRRTPASQPADDPRASQPDLHDDEFGISAALTAQLEHHSESAATGSSPSAPTPQDAVDARPTHSAPGANVEGQGDDSQSPLQSAGESPENDEDLLNPFTGRKLPRSPLRTVLRPPGARESPELPPTPQNPDPVVSTPPSGIHNTPSKRRRPGNVAGVAARPTSPTKEDSQRKEQHGLGSGPPPQKNTHKTMALRVARRGSPKQIVEQKSPPSQKGKEPEGRPRSEFAPGTHPRRSIRLNPHAQKESERDALLKEVERLEADLELATRANDSAAKGLHSSADNSEVVDLLRRHLLPAEGTGTETESNGEWLEAAMNPMALLGFNGMSSLNIPPPIQEKKEEVEPPPISHHPIPMTASEELPYLQVFTPLAFTSTITTLPPSPDDEGGPTLQKHTIHIRSAAPPGLFVAQLEMTVNTRTHAVSGLTVPRLDPATADELRLLVNRVCHPMAPHHSALSRNVNVLTWAMGEWYRVALKRAKFWHALERQLGPEAKDGQGELVRAMRTRKKRRRRGQGQQQGEDANVGASFESAGSGSLDGMLLSKADLLPHMGRTSMDLEVPCSAEANGIQSELRVRWRIDFDWTGEARSDLGVEVGVPAKWQAADDRNSIVGLPKLFNNLIKGGEDPLTAVKTVVALLAGEPPA
ncbi:hypothetical protein VPNG_07129 [Cytospora leucostoma]|uniref:Uncharacterized protein n=1 Tax=Cytospora leucostoma TaxID=1230097 RepID=A0A423WVP2_9PEZI|nr:hypothetical protein VPNG_07129 [Cytospora leucostoma]